MLRRALACAAAWTAIAGAGCGESSNGGTPPPLSTASPPPRDAGRDTTTSVDASPADAGPMSRRFIGTLSAATPSEFGGPPYCKYEITLKQIEVDITLTKEGNLANAKVTNLALEETLPPCTFGGIEPNIHTYTLASSRKLPTGAQALELSADPSNSPMAAVAIEARFDENIASAVVEWHRIDQGPPLDWRVTATVMLQKRDTQ